MDRTLILDCNNKIDQEVKLCGWVQVRRDHGKIVFLELADRTGVLQVVLTGEQAGNLGPQDVVCIEGKLVKRPEKLANPSLETGSIELQGSRIEVLAKAAELPFDMSSSELNLLLPTLLDFRSLTLRHTRIKDIFKVQASVLEGFRRAAMLVECTEIVVPTVAASATEGGAEVFKVDYYGYKAYMTQSPQLYKQMLVPTFERVWTIAHAYRSEPSVTTRHLSETTQMDCEFGFVDFEQLLDITETVGKQMLTFAYEQNKQIFAEFGVAAPLVEAKIPRLKLREAQEVIFREFGRDNRHEKDLSPQDEVDICAWAKQKHNSDLVIITHFPTSKRAFYTMPDPDAPEYSLSMDVLFRGLEILSGSMRINNYDQLVEAIKSRGMNPENFEMYLQAFKYGMPPEGGFSYGMERVTKQLLMLENIREASLYPRDMERVDLRLSTLK